MLRHSLCATLVADEYERAVDLVSGQAGSAPPIALEHQELLKELGAWVAPEVSEEGDDPVAAAAAAKTMVQAASQERYEKMAAQREAVRLAQEERAALQKQMKAARTKARVVDG